MKRRSLGAAVAAVAVQVLGLTAPAASAEAVASPTRDPGVTRLAGADRYETAAAISRASSPGTSADVFIVSGTNWPDGLSAGAAAAKVNGTLLPVEPTGVPQVIGDEVARLHPERVWIVGGTSAVSEKVTAQLKQKGYRPVRIGGRNRYETAAGVANRFFSMSTSGAYYASGASFADALAGGAAAAQRGVPLLLTANTKPAATPVVSRAKIALGGPSVLSDAAVAALGARRVFGADRYATAVAVAKDAYPSARNAYLANGLSFPDALSATPAARRDLAPVLLTRPGCVTTGTAAEFARLGATSRLVVGGTTAVSDAAANLVVCPSTPPVGTPVAPAPTRPANPGDDKNCSDFPNQVAAQAYFDRYYPAYGDVSKLDRDNNGIACESLR